MKNTTSEVLITGKLVIVDGETRSAPIEAEIRVLKNDKLINMTVANVFGQFTVRLAKGSGKHILEFAGDDFKSLKTEVIADEIDQNLGIIELKRI